MSTYTSQRDRVLNALRSGRWVSIGKFVSLGVYRYGGRIHELRRMGYEIESREQYAGRSRRVWYRLSKEKR